MSRGSKALNKSHVYTQNQLEKLHFTNEKLNLNDPFPQMNKPYSHNLAPPVRSASSKGSQLFKSKSSSGSSNASRKELVKAELLADQEKLKAERKLEKSKLQEKQFRLQQELEKAEILENLEEAQNKLKLAKILDNIESVEKSDSNSIDEYQINSRPKFDSNHKQNLFNQNPSPLLHNPQKKNFNITSEIKKHTIHHNSKTDPPRTKPFISPTLETKNPELPRKSTYYSVDDFIDELIEGQETIISSDVCNKFDALTFSKAEYESRNLPPIKLYKFSGDPSKWPEFIENFSTHVHFKTTFSDNQRMERLLNVLKDGSVYWAKRHSLFNNIETSKTRLWIASYLKLKELFDQPQLQAKNKPAIRSFQQQLKTAVIWLSSMGYHSAIRSTDNITKVVTHLPTYLRNKFYKEFKTNDIDENKVDLLNFVTG